MDAYLPRWLRPANTAQDEAATRPDDDCASSGVSSPSLAVDDTDAHSTPVAATEPSSDAVSHLSLNDHSSHKDGRDASSLLTTAPSAKPAAGRASGLMPPPTRLSTAPKMPSNSTASLRVPTTGPLPNRGPPSNSQQRASSGKSSNARGKVQLAPGHSPMDWAALARRGDLAGVATFQRVTPSQLRAMTGRKGKPAWTSWQGKVYNITPYLPFHPGGEPELMRCAGRDGTQLFMDVHPWVNFENMLGSCLVGVMVPEGHGTHEGGSSLEDMD